MVSGSHPASSAGHPGSAVLEEEATGDIKGIFEDIKKTFRVPFVSSVFRELASRPDYLRVAWRQLHTNAQTVYFERSADELRTLVVERVAAMADAPSCPDDARSAVKLLHYLNPRLLIAVAALRAATSGERPKLVDLPAGDKRQIAAEVPDQEGSLSMVDPVTAGERVQHVFQEMRSALGDSLPDDALVLAVWPEYLETAWSALGGLVNSPSYLQLQRELRLFCEDTVLAFPFRMDLSPHTLRHSGLSEADIDAVHSILRRAHDSLVRLVVGAAYLAAGGLGKEEATKSPFPARVL
jgi:hypothetical protein